LPLRELVAQALVNKGLSLDALSRSEDEIAIYDDLIARFGAATELPLRKHVAQALVNKGISLETLGRSADAIVVYDHLIARFGAATELPLREQVAQALVNKGLSLDTLGRSVDEIAVYDDLIARFGVAMELPLRKLVAQALYNKGSRSAPSAAATTRLPPMTTSSPATARRRNCPARTSRQGTLRQGFRLGRSPQRRRDCGLRRPHRPLRRGDGKVAARTGRQGNANEVEVDKASQIKAKVLAKIVISLSASAKIYSKSAQDNCRR